MKKIKLNNGMESIVDDESYDMLAKYNWLYIMSGKNSYAKSHVYVEGKFINVYMHRLILGIDSKEYDIVVDHINGNGIDNRKDNLRVVTRQQNLMNQSRKKNNFSGFIGVYKSRKRYMAQIRVNKKLVYLGSFKTIEEAVSARKEAEKKYFGEYAGQRED